MQQEGHLYTHMQLVLVFVKTIVYQWRVCSI